MRRKNRQIRVTLDIPEVFEDDETFMICFRDRLDELAKETESPWCITVIDPTDEDDNPENMQVPISKISMGELEIEPEDEDDGK